MIKTYLKHQIIDKFINTVFDGFISTFKQREPYKFNVGDEFMRIDVIKCFTNPFTGTSYIQKYIITTVRFII